MPDSSNPQEFIKGTFDNGPRGEVLYSTIANQTLTLGTSDSLLARVVMTTVGSTVGSYSMRLSELAAIDNGFNSISSSASGPLSYSITAVPEPSSMLLAAIGVGAAAWKSRKRLQKNKS
ncbi:MAG: PEP-CTERM sorting domain-containing protein [Planctomycetota bacterium]|nr:PEP-CTERM sorting domain-containing protein [Planctomycetota bacterium]